MRKQQEQSSECDARTPASLRLYHDYSVCNAIWYYNMESSSIFDS